MEGTSAPSDGSAHGRYTAITRRRIDPTTRSPTVRRIPRAVAANPLFLAGSLGREGEREGGRAPFSHRDRRKRAIRKGQEVGKRSHGLDTPGK